MGMIRMNYSEVFAEARRLANLADQGENCLRQLRTAAANIPTYWTGEASDAFVHACHRWEREMYDLVRLLNMVSHNLRTVAREIREAEERARQAAANAFLASK